MLGRICLAQYWLILSSTILAHSVYFIFGFLHSYGKRKIGMRLT
jgi:hypothetical protein